MSARGTYRFHSVQRQTILLVNGESLGRLLVVVVIFFYFSKGSTWMKHSYYNKQNDENTLFLNQPINIYSQQHGAAGCKYWEFADKSESDFLVFCQEKS